MLVPYHHVCLSADSLAQKSENRASPFKTLQIVKAEWVVFYLNWFRHLHRSSTSSLGSGGSSQKDGATGNSAMVDAERLKKKNAMLEKTVDNLEQTVQDTMARMNDVKDVNQELKTVRQSWR